ncbi:hypothetical protein [Shewanella spartinae]|uniref:hypothetical protein n=1 Tax=Shewanella spartinae TaxID=2864205 RepID=UPI001C65C36F|nr:hypothetical protein [Shewanella spartinae]QYJ93626.1 hypothetical protein K0I31_18935 [Shewanella spartinae]
MKIAIFDDFLIGGWAYARRKGVSHERACGLAIAQVQLFILFTFTPWLVALLKYLTFDNANIMYFIVGFSIALGILFNIYTGNRNMFTNIDLNIVEVRRKIKKCTYFFIFLFFYMPISTYFLWPVIRQF